MQRDLNIATVVFAFISFVFFIIGCIGYSSDELVMKNTPWVTADDNGQEVYMNLQGIFFKNAGGKGTVFYANANCGLDFCDQCAEQGDAAFGLIIAATVFASFTTVLSGILSASPSSTLQLVNLFVAFVTAVFSLVGFGLFMGGCYVQFDNYSPLSLHYGAGAILTLIGLLMMWLTVFFQVGAVFFGVK